MSNAEHAGVPLVDEPGHEAAGAATGSAVVSFFTTTFAKHMPEQVFSVPLSVLPDGLNRLVQSVLETPEQSFDFLYHDEYIGTSLLRFLHRRSISPEEVLHIEYTPALQAKEGTLLPHDDWVRSVRAPLLGNGDVLLTGAYDHGVRLWDGDHCVALGVYHRECVKEVCLHPVAPTSSQPAAATSGATRRKRGRATRDVEDFRCVSCSKDGSVAAWHFDSAAAQLRLLGTVHAHGDGVDTVHVSPLDGELVATASWDGSVKLFHWDDLTRGRDTMPSTVAPLLTFTDHTRPVLACRFSEANASAQVLSAGLDGTVKCLNVEQAQLQYQFAGDHVIQGIAVKPAAASADLVLTACTDNRARLYDTRQRQVVRTFSGHRQWLYSAAWLWSRQEGDSAGTGDLFVTASEDATVRVFDLRCTNTALLTMDTLHTDGVLDVSYAGQSVIVSCGKDNSTKSFSITKEQL